MNPRVKSVEVIKGYELILTFANEEKKMFNIEPYLSFPAFSSLKNREIFEKPKVLFGAVTWKGNIDFDPDTMYLEGKIISK